MNLAIITGTRSGIGKALAEALVNDGNWKVEALNRPVFDLETIHMNLDRLNDISRLCQRGGFERVVFVMNAARMHIAPAYDPTHAGEVIRTNLTNHIMVAATLMRACRDIKNKLEVALVSSMAARLPQRYWSCYAASKAGLEAYLRCVSHEGYRTHLLVPTAVDTAMQTKLRETDWPDASHFRELYDTGRLSSPEDTVTGWVERLNRNAVETSEALRQSSRQLSSSPGSP